MKFNHLKNIHLGKCTITNAEGGFGAGNTGYPIQRACIPFRHHQPVERNSADRGGRYALPFTHQIKKFRSSGLYLAGIIIGAPEKVLCTNRKRKKILHYTNRILEPVGSIS